MSNLSYKNFTRGIAVVPKATSENATKGDIEVLTSNDKLHYYNGTVNDAVVTETVTATLTNKTLTAPIIATIVNVGTLTLPTSTDTLVGRNTTDTLTNKTIDGDLNTLVDIGNASLVNDSVTINGQTVALGGSITVTGATDEPLTIGTGLTGTSFDGSVPVTITIDSTVVTLTGTQTLTNKTLTSPTINVINGLAATDLTITADTNNSVILNTFFSVDPTTQSAKILSNNSLQLYDTDNSNYVGLSASPTTTTNYNIVFPAAAPTANTSLVYTGSGYVWGQAGGWSTYTSTSLTAGGTVAISLTVGQQLYIVAGTSAVTLSNTPFGTSAPTDGTVIRLICNSNSNTVSLVNNNSAKGCILNGNITLFQYDCIEFQYSASLDRWIEISRNQ